MYAIELEYCSLSERGEKDVDDTQLPLPINITLSLSKNTNRESEISLSKQQPTNHNRQKDIMVSMFSYGLKEEQIQSNPGVRRDGRRRGRRGRGKR